MLESLFIFVLNMSLVASYVITFVLLARLLFKKAPKIFSFALWLVVLLRLLCPFTFDSAIGLLPSNTAPTPQDIIYSQQPHVDTGIGMVDNIVNSTLPVPNVGESMNPLQAWTFIGSYIWLIGIANMLIYSTVQLIKLKKQLVGSTPLRDNICLADQISSPFVMGFIKPMTYLPSSLTEAEQEFIIAHEKHHIQRFDHITRILAFIALTIHWFNPLVWLAFILSGKDMEMSCDEAVMKKIDTDIRAEYSQSLLYFATGRKFITATPLAFGEGDTKDRVKNVMRYKKPMIGAVIALIVVVIAFIFMFGTNSMGFKRETMKEAQNLSVADVAKIELVVQPSNENERYRLFDESEFANIVELVNESKGSYVKNPELLNGGGITLYITKKYGNMLVISNNGNTYLHIGKDTFKADYNWLNNEWNFRGNQALPDNFHYGQVDTEKAQLNDLKPMLMVDGKLYLDTGKEEPMGAAAAVDGKILSTVEQTEKPVENGQSNFGEVGSSYCADDNGVVVRLNDKWIRFAPEKLTHDQTVTLALTSNGNRYLEGECTAEGHIILGYDDSDANKTKIYALTMIGWYGFENNNFVKVSGSGIIPAVVTLDSNNTVEIEHPLDGSGYRTSIEKLFPQEYRARIFEHADSDYDNLKQQEQQYAKDYLKKLNRKAEIGDYSDFEHILLTHVGVSVEVSNELENFYKEHNYYPSFIGTCERLENGTRMVYEMSYHKNQDEIRLMKYAYDTKETVEQFILNATTGDIVTLSDGTPKVNE